MSSGVAIKQFTKKVLQKYNFLVPGNIGITKVVAFVLFAIDISYTSFELVRTCSIIFILYFVFLIGTVRPSVILRSFGPSRATITPFFFTGFRHSVLPVILNVKAFTGVYIKLSHCTTIILLGLKILLYVLQDLVTLYRFLLTHLLYFLVCKST